MPENTENKINKVADRLMFEMFQVKPGEVVAITADTGSDEQLVKALLNSAHKAGGKPLVLQFPKARDNAQAGIMDWPADALTAALSNVDVWLEVNEVFMLYSDIWETTMAKNKKLRFLTITGSSVDSLDRVFCNYDIPTMGKLLKNIKELIIDSQIVRVTTARGTDVSFEIEPKYIVDIDDGDFSKPKFSTAPGYVNIVPKPGTMKGRIVFDMIMHTDLSDGGHVEFLMDRGRIIDFIGDKSPAIKEYIEQFNEENMYKISHMMIGLNPGVRELSWEIVEDERIWGGVDFGFGHTSPIDMPPEGQPATSHFDGVMERASVYLDENCIIEKGVIARPDLKEFGDQLLNENLTNGK